jgi:hypothetical protein
VQPRVRAGLFAVLQLALNADLHVIDQERKALRIADIFEPVWNIDAEGLFHGLAPCEILRPVFIARLSGDGVIP